MSRPIDRLGGSSSRTESDRAPKRIPLPRWLALPKLNAERKDAFQGPAGTARRDPKTWWEGRPLGEARNAHSTNTKEHFEEALKSGANFFECDVRKELNSDTLECRHDPGQEAGDNLTLAEWLAKGKEAGIGLKVELKEPQHTRQMIETIKKAGIPSERLMLNMGVDDIAKWGPELRKAFPKATIAVSGGSEPKITSGDVDKMLAAAKGCGEPVTFVVRYDTLTDEAIGRLKQRGTVSVWNSLTKAPGDPEGEAESLRRRGVDGMIDLRGAPSLSEKIGIGFDKANGWLQDQGAKVESGVDKAKGWVKDHLPFV